MPAFAGKTEIGEFALVRNGLGLPDGTRRVGTVEDLLADFEVLDDWEDRYRHVIELGRGLPPFDDASRNARHKVQGCASQVWITSQLSGSPDDPVITFSGDSDALIVKGLIAIAFMIYSGQRASEIAKIDAAAILRQLGLDDHLTPQRSNGFASMIARIKADGAHAFQTSSSAGIAGR